jgi:hypothetical protein
LLAKGCIRVSKRVSALCARSYPHLSAKPSVRLQIRWSIWTWLSQSFACSLEKISLGEPCLPPVNNSSLYEYPQETTRKHSAKPSASSTFRLRRAKTTRYARSSPSCKTCTRAGCRERPQRKPHSPSSTTRSRSDSRSSSRILMRPSTASSSPSESSSSFWMILCRWMKTRTRKMSCRRRRRSALRGSAGGRASRRTLRVWTMGHGRPRGARAARRSLSTSSTLYRENSLIFCYTRRRPTSPSDGDDEDDEQASPLPTVVPTRTMPRRAA